jgi:drug/metabolite transporter (DMT)-like permease
MTPTILLATASSLLFGCSDFLGGLASRRDSAIAIVANSHLLALVVLAIAMLLFPAPFGAGDLGWGAAAGVAGGIGVAALYAALARGRMSVVAPLTAALSGSLPAVYDLLRGTEVRPIALAGLAVALVAVVIVSTNGHPDDRAAMPVSAITLSVLAGVGFGTSFIFFSFAGRGSGLMPLVAARVVSASLMLALAFFQRGRVTVHAGVRSSTFAAGALDAGANVAMLAAIRVGPLAVASVLGSLYPVVTILLARVVLHERLRWVQRAGVALALVAVVLTSLR